MKLTLTLMILALAQTTLSVRVFESRPAPPPPVEEEKKHPSKSFWVNGASDKKVDEYIKSGLARDAIVTLTVERNGDAILSGLCSHCIKAHRERQFSCTGTFYCPRADGAISGPIYDFVTKTLEGVNLRAKVYRSNANGDFKVGRKRSGDYVVLGRRREI